MNMQSIYPSFGSEQLIVLYTAYYVRQLDMILLATFFFSCLS